MREVNVRYEYGSYSLKIKGDPNRLFDVPIAYYTAPAFGVTSNGVTCQTCDKINNAYAVDKAAEDNQ